MTMFRKDRGRGAARINDERRAYFPFDVPLSSSAWKEHEVGGLLPAHLSRRGADMLPVLRRLCDRMNRKRDFSHHMTQPARAGHLMGGALLTRVLRYLLERYVLEECPGSCQQALDWVSEHRDSHTVSAPTAAFLALFPPVSVQRGAVTGGAYLEGGDDDQPNRHSIAQQMILLELTMENRALAPFRELFDDGELRHHAPYQPMVGTIEEFYERQPEFEPAGERLFALLRAPMQASPDSLDGQLKYIAENWADWLPDDLLQELLLAEDVLKEEARMRGLGPGAIEALRFGREYAYGYDEPARFTDDRDWMSNVVLIAKSTYVWLDQLSKKYKRSITRLDEVPDEELDRLARWGFTGLWLIGLWERSPASRKIKQMMGNPEAVSSAYSLYAYDIATDLGGDSAYQNLRDRAWQRGIRLASDMVPNHMGIYSKWVVEHPDWFLQLNEPPYPNYRFSCEDLSDDERVGLYIEDGYWNHSDAAVVFKRVDHWTGATTYIYHGNDGTSMPWNDTAQLNFLIPAVREAVLQTILHVARHFPIIRFDAAMTLAKRHYQRLWFPQPGEGGAIPSRAEHGMSRAQFDEVFPEEFWRQVVDRINAEAPDTLLLAEAFWLMEGYFVRTLGMHRVYNSAFMNMLKMEDNAKYRTTVKNTLEFSPEVLKRFVNFMNNPDERTAVDQFGKDDKYYGVAVLMVTMPGLPMFGHGQVEGFAEKYGMEYRRAYWDEEVDDHMVRRHEAEIFPLMRRRRLFSGSANFAFYDYWTDGGWVDENVFAYSNRAGDERALILYNNAFNTTQGWVKTSSAVNVGDADNKQLVQRTLAEALNLEVEDHIYYVFRDHRTGLEYLRHSHELAQKGLWTELHGYEYRAYLDWRAVYDEDLSWARLSQNLAGGGTPNMLEAYWELELVDILTPFRTVMNPEILRELDQAADAEASAAFEQRLTAFLDAAAARSGVKTDTAALARTITASVGMVGRIIRELPDGQSKVRLPMEEIVPHVAWEIVRRLAEFTPGEGEASARCAALLDAWLLKKPIMQALCTSGCDEATATAKAQLVALMIGYPDALASEKAFAALLDDPAPRAYLQANWHNGVHWINKERLESLTHTLLAAYALDEHLKQEAKSALEQRFGTMKNILDLAEEAGYDLEKLQASLRRAPAGKQA